MSIRLHARKPWQVRIDYDVEIGPFIAAILHHTHASIAFSVEASEYYGGVQATDEDGYVVECEDMDAKLIQTALEIARLSTIV